MPRRRYRSRLGVFRGPACLLGLAALLVAGACATGDGGRQSPASASPDIELGTLRAGDVLLRRGTSLNSHAVLLADRASHYSHVGLVAEKDGALVVVNSVPGTEEDAGGVRAEPVASFLSPDKAIAWTALRLAADPDGVAPRAATAALALAERKASFDDDFDLEDPSEIYCTELVWLAYRGAGLDLVDGTFDSIDFPLVPARTVILPSRIQHSPYLTDLRTPDPMRKSP